MEYWAKIQQLNVEFKAALAKEFNLVNHPKLDKLFDLAWEHGNSAGYTEVAMYFEEFAELLGG